MQPETRAFLDSVRAGDNPTQEDEDRVLGALHASIAAGVVAGVTATGTVQGSAAQTAGSATQTTGAVASGGAQGGASLVSGSASTLSAKAAGLVTLKGALKIGLAGVFITASGVGLVQVLDERTPQDTPTVTHTQPSASAAKERGTTPAPLPPKNAEDAEDAEDAESAEKVESAEQTHPEAQPSAPERRSPQTTTPSPPLQERAAPTPPHKSSSEPKSPPPSLKGELDHLQRVRAAVQQGQGERALTLLSGHRTRDQQFATERGALKVLALCAAGRVAAARAALADFEKRFPNSVQRHALARSCAASD